VKRLVEPVAAGVAGEDAAGAVAAVGGGREADDEEAGGRIAEPRHRLAPVGLVAELPLPDLRHGLAVAPEPGAAGTADDLAAQVIEAARCQNGHSGRRRSSRSLLSGPLGSTWAKMVRISGMVSVLAG
jgi:hypothetical protein